MRLTGVIVAAFVFAPLSAFAAENCAGLTKARLFAQTKIASAKSVDADVAKGIVAHCEVTGTVSPEPNSNIGIVYRLPPAGAWNGKIVGLGGGGFTGNPRLEVAAPK